MAGIAPERSIGSSHEYRSNRIIPDRRIWRSTLRLRNHPSRFNRSGPAQPDRQGRFWLISVPGDRARLPGPSRLIAVGSRPDQRERLELGVVRRRCALGSRRGVDRVRSERVEIPDGDGGLIAGVPARIYVEHGDAVTGRGVPAGRPDRVLACVRSCARVYVRRSGRAGLFGIVKILAAGSPSELSTP